MIHAYLQTAIEVLVLYSSVSAKDSWWVQSWGHLLFWKLTEYLNQHRNWGMDR